MGEGAAEEDTHKTSLFLDSSSSSSSLHPHLLCMRWPCLAPPFSRSSAAACVYSAKERERMRERQKVLGEGTMLPFREIVDPTSKEVCMGASQHPFPKLRGHSPLSFGARTLTHAHTHAHAEACSFFLFRRLTFSFPLVSPKALLSDNRCWSL